ncbi:lipase member I-like isoform X2 [Cydia pomonella]|uniref:lipase member I-like isoform X2 n=1 Tax=Cydia pomonella TaxID=82600 RepID=UPI002ADD7E4A|nr:lipase member I-like isoform X2 [Cydia pomonella]
MVRELIVNGTEYVNLVNTVPAISELEFLDGSQNIAIVIHGRDSSAFSEFGQTLRSSFITSDHELTVILVDWALVASMDYATAINAVPFVADDIIALIVQLEAANKINRSLVHIVGFDIGAHIAGLVSRDSRARVQRITGLSPAGQNWDSFSRRLRATDANYVEVVHTDYSGTRAFGISETIGTVDIFANTGTRQPGCANNQCNHDRAWQLFGATLDMGGHLMGLRCDSLADMTRNRCVGAPAVSLGTNDLFKLGTGIYRVNTGRAYPYNS